ELLGLHHVRPSVRQGVGVLQVRGRGGGPVVLPHLGQPAQRVVLGGAGLAVDVDDRGGQALARVERRRRGPAQRVGHGHGGDRPTRRGRVCGGGLAVEGVVGGGGPTIAVVVGPP